MKNGNNQSLKIRLRKPEKIQRDSVQLDLAYEFGYNEHQLNYSWQIPSHQNH